MFTSKLYWVQSFKVVIFVMNVPFHFAAIAKTVNPLVSPPYLFQTQLTWALNRDRGLFIWGGRGLFNLAKTMVLVLYKEL